MLLGKRQRPPFKRTTSMTEIKLDLTDIPEADGAGGAKLPEVFDLNGLDHRFAAAANVSPRPKLNRRNSAGAAVETAPFLKTCFFCKRRLVSGRDIFMYRGDSAFCSPECRQQQINQDEKKEKRSLTLATKKEAASIVAASSQVSSNGETLAAV